MGGREPRRAVQWQSRLAVLFLLPGRGDPLQMEVPSPARQRSLARVFHTNVLTAASARGSPRAGRAPPCPLLLIADNALKIQSHICSFQHEYRGIYVVYNDRV